MKSLIALLIITLPLLGQEIIIKPAGGHGEAVKVDVSGPTNIVLNGKAYLIEPAKKTTTQIMAENLKIPSINFKGTSVEDAVMYFNNRRAEIHRVDGKPAFPNIVTHGKFPKPIDELRVRNVSYHEALRLIAIKTGAKIEYRDEVIMVIGKE